VIDKLLATIIAALAPPAPQTAQAAPPATDYAQDSSWLCLPGRKDICSTPLATTALGPNGYGSTAASTIAKDPPLDCFYVYPTVSNDQGLNSDLDAGREERLAVEAQFARFASVCRTFAPTYRQMTIGAIAAFAAGVDISDAGEIAYRDVRAAWRNYLATRNHGRPFVLIGHSQGSLMLQQLIAREIETDPAVAKRMKVAIIPGYDVLVPQGKLVGGTFKETPLCSDPDQTGCVMAWSSYREGDVPPEGAMFGFAPTAGMTIGCVNPALSGSKQWTKLDSMWFARSTYTVRGGPVSWSSEGPPPSAYLSTDGLVSGKCVNDGRRGYFAIRTNHQPGDKWTDHVGGEVSVLGIFLPGWGMHLADLSVVQGDLIARLEAISARSRTAPRH
jgi:DUF3089 family protein